MYIYPCTYMRQRVHTHLNTSQKPPSIQCATNQESWILHPCSFPEPNSGHWSKNFVLVIPMPPSHLGWCQHQLTITLNNKLTSPPRLELTIKITYDHCCVVWGRYIAVESYTKATGTFYFIWISIIKNTQTSVYFNIIQYKQELMSLQIKFK